MRTAERIRQVPTRGRVMRWYSMLTGAAALLVFLQGLWAGIFIREGHDFRQSWVDVHARGAEVAIVLAAVAAALSLWRLRSRIDLVAGSAAFTVLLVIEAFVGGHIGNSPGMTTVHIPLGMALMGLAVWLPIRARHQ